MLFLDPPASLTISGYEENTHIDAGAVLKLLCIATAGNPLANVTWYKNDKEVSGVVQLYIFNLMLDEEKFYITIHLFIVFIKALR